MLNERTEKTKKIIHLMVTTLCKRKCPHCCNNHYPELREDTKSMFVYASVLHKMSRKKQKVAYYLIGKALDA